MDKAPEQPEAPQSALAERLMRRRTEPIGVVDVRQPQMLYTRTAGWVAQRFGLLDRWRERYGADEQSWQRGDELVFASPALPSSDLAEAAPREPAVRRSAIPPSSGIAPSPGVASAPLLRVSRRRSNRTVVARTAEPSGGIADASGADGGVESVQRVRTAESAGPEETAHSTAPMVFRQRDEGRIESSPEPSTGEPSSLFAPTRAAENFVSTGAAPPTGRLLDRRMADPGPAASAPAAISATPPVLARSRELDWPGAPSAEARVWRTGPRSGLQAAPAGSMAPAARLELRRESETAASQVGGQVESTGPSAVSAEAPLPLAPALPVVQRRFEVEGIETGAAAPRTSPTASAIESPRMAVAAEIPPERISAARSHMIWRQSAGSETFGGYSAAGRPGFPGSPLPLRIEAVPVTPQAPVVARQVGNGPVSEPGTTASPMPPSAPPESAAPNRGLDLGQLAEQVGRLLSRQLTVERERRGMK